MRYRQITAHERYTLGVLRKQGLTNAAIARVAASAPAIQTPQTLRQLRKAGTATLIGKLPRRNVAALNKRVIDLIHAHPGLFKTITADNGTEFHGYEEIEQATGVKIYFATPYHS